MTTLVLGGTGKTGRRVARRLHALERPVRIGSRSGRPPFDWNDRATWGPALEGVTSAYVTFQPDVAVPGAAAAVGALAERAGAAGVRRLVLLSGRGEEGALEAERALRDAADAAGAEWTIVRSSFFTQNFSEDFMLEAVLAGEVALPVGDVPEPFIDIEDIADVAVAALTDDRHAGRTYEVTGPRALTFTEATAEIGAAIGREIRYVPVTVDEYARAAEAVLPAEEARAIATLFAKVLDGRNSRPADGVREVTGRDATDFRDFVKAAAAEGAWS